MQSYKLHLVSEHLKDRHPYIEAPFNERYDSSEVYHAVFDRSIPKLIEILLMTDIEQNKYRDSLITLNEMVSHQEQKDEMISQGLVGVASAYLHHKIVEIRREAVLLLGSLVSIQRGRQQLNQVGFDGLSKMLFDESLPAREACGWALCRIVTGRDGVDLLCNSSLTEVIIKSFMKYTENPNNDVARFDIYLLEVFTRLLQYDNGIIFFLNCGVVKRLNDILKNINDAYFDQHFTERVNYLSLDCLAKICGNTEGKQEGIDQQIIATASEFLDSPILEESQYSTILIMNCTIHLDGKKQCVHVEDDKIIFKLIGLLDTKIQELRRDVKQALSNIAEFPEGFEIITSKLASNIHYLDDLFGPRVVIALANLLPRTSILDKPPQLPIELIDQYKVYCSALCSFLRDYDDALVIAVEQTVKIQEKLAPLLVYRQLSDVVAHSLYRLCNYDQGCKEGLYNYIMTYGDVVIDISKSTLKEEIKSYKKLHEVLLRN